MLHPYSLSRSRMGLPSCWYLSLGANDAGHLSPGGVFMAWQCSTIEFNWVDQCMVLIHFVMKSFRLLIPAKVLGTVVFARLWDQVPRVLWFPVLWTLCIWRNHEDCWPLFHVANDTWCRSVSEWAWSAAVLGRERAVAIYSAIVELVFYSCEGSLIVVRVTSGHVIFPLWPLRQTEITGSATGLIPAWPGRMTFQQE